MLNSVLQKKAIGGVLGNGSRSRSGSRSGSRKVIGRVGHRQQNSQESEDFKQGVKSKHHKKKLSMSNNIKDDYSQKDGDRLTFKRKSSAKVMPKSTVEESYQGFNGSKDQVLLTNLRSTESTIRQISKPTESTMRSNQPLVCNLLAQVPLPERVDGDSGLFTLGNNTHVDRYLMGKSDQDAYNGHEFGGRESRGGRDPIEFSNQFSNNLQLQGSAESSGFLRSMEKEDAFAEIGNQRLIVSNSGNMNNQNSDYNRSHIPTNSTQSSRMYGQIPNRVQIMGQTTQSHSQSQHVAYNNDDDQRAYFTRNKDQMKLARISEENHTAANSSVTSKRASEKSGTQPSSRTQKSRVKDNSLSQFFNEEEMMLLNMKFEQQSPPENGKQFQESEQFSFKKHLDAKTLEDQSEFGDQLTGRSQCGDEVGIERRYRRQQEPRGEGQEEKRRVTESRESGSFDRSRSISETRDRKPKTSRPKLGSSQLGVCSLNAETHQNTGSHSRSNSQHREAKHLLASSASNQDEYMQIYESLIVQALALQTQSLRQVDSDIYKTPGTLITRSNTKSFRELCHKLILQNKDLINFTIDAKSQHNALNHDLTSKQHTKTQELQQLQELNNKQDAKLKSVERQLLEHKQKDEQSMQDLYKLKQSQSQKDQQIISLNQSNREMQTQCEKMEDIIGRQREEIRKNMKGVSDTDIGKKEEMREIVVIQMDPILQSKFNLEPYLNLKQGQKQFQHFYDIIHMLYVENDNLKEKYRQSVDQKQVITSEAEQRVVRLQEHLENVKMMFNKKLITQKEMMDDINQLQCANIVNLKIKTTECAQLTQQVEVSLADARKSREEQLSLRKTLQVAREQLNHAISSNDTLEQQIKTLDNELYHTKDQNEVYQQQIESYREETTHLRGMDVQVLLSLDHRGRLGRGREKSSKNSDMPFHRNHLSDSIGSFCSQFQGVSVFAQGVSQAQQIEKFLKLDISQKNQIKELKENLNEFCSDFAKIDNKIQAVVNEKESLEKLLLELVGFSECCDERFDQLMDKIKDFSEQDQKQYTNMKSSYDLIKVQLTETVKNMIVEIEDHSIRDELLSILTELNDKPLHLAVGQLVEKLVSRLRDLLLKNKRLVAINTEQAREAAQTEEQVSLQLQNQERESRQCEKMARDIDILSQRIIIKISDSQMKYNQPNSAQTFRSEIDILERVNMPLEQIFSQINLALSLISEWTIDQIVQIPINFKNRELLERMSRTPDHQIKADFDDTLTTKHNFSVDELLQTEMESPVVEKNQKMLLQEILNKVTGLRNQTEASPLRSERENSRSGCGGGYLVKQRTEPVSEHGQVSRSRSGSNNHPLRRRKRSSDRDSSQFRDQYSRIEYHGSQKSTGPHAQTQGSTTAAGRGLSGSFDARISEGGTQHSMIRLPHQYPPPHGPLLKETTLAHNQTGAADWNNARDIWKHEHDAALIINHRNPHFKKPHPQHVVDRLSSGGRSSSASPEKAINSSLRRPIAHHEETKQIRQKNEQQRPWVQSGINNTAAPNKCVTNRQMSGQSTPRDASSVSKHSYPRIVPLRQQCGHSNGSWGYHGRHSSNQSQSYSSTSPVSRGEHLRVARPTHQPHSRALRLKQLPQDHQSKQREPLYARSAASQGSYDSRHSQSLSNHNDYDRISHHQNQKNATDIESKNNVKEQTGNYRQQQPQEREGQRMAKHVPHHSMNETVIPQDYLQGPQRSLHSKDIKTGVKHTRGLALGTLGEGQEADGHIQAHSVILGHRQGSQEHLANHNDSIMTVAQQELPALYRRRQDQNERQSQKSSKTTVRRDNGAPETKYVGDGSFQSKAARRVVDTQQNHAQETKAQKEKDEYSKRKNPKQVLNERLSQQYDHIEQERKASGIPRAASLERQNENQNIFNTNSEPDSRPCNLPFQKGHAQSITSLSAFHTLQSPVDLHSQRSQQSKSHSSLQTLQERDPEKLQKIGQLLENQRKLLSLARDKRFDSSIFQTPEIQALLDPNSLTTLTESIQMLESNQPMSESDLFKIRKSNSQMTKGLNKAQTHHQSSKRRTGKESVSKSSRDSRIEKAQKMESSAKLSAPTAGRASSKRRRERPIIKIKAFRPEKNTTAITKERNDGPKHKNNNIYQSRENFPTFQQNTKNVSEEQNSIQTSAGVIEERQASPVSRIYFNHRNLPRTQMHSPEASEKGVQRQLFSKRESFSQVSNSQNNDGLVFGSGNAGASGSLRSAVNLSSSAQNTGQAGDYQYASVPAHHSSQASICLSQNQNNILSIRQSISHVDGALHIPQSEQSLYLASQQLNSRDASQQIKLMNQSASSKIESGHKSKEKSGSRWTKEQNRDDDEALNTPPVFKDQF